MTAQATDALVDAIDASYGLPVPSPRGFAARIEQQLALRGYEIAPKPGCFWCSSPTEACRVHPPACATCGAALVWYEDDPTRQVRRWRHADLTKFYEFGAHPSVPIIDQRGPDIGS